MSSTCKEVDQLGLSCTAGVDTKQYRQKCLAAFKVKFNIYLPYYPEIPLLRVLLREMKIYINIKTNQYLAINIY